MTRAIFGEVGKQDYGTPQDLYNFLDKTYNFALDAAATWENTLHASAYIAPVMPTQEDVRRWSDLVRPEGNAIPDHRVADDLFPWPVAVDCLAVDWREAIKQSLKDRYDPDRRYAVFLNPPYGQRIVKPTPRHPDLFPGTEAFVSRCYQQAVEGNLTVVGLLPAKTDARWFDVCMKADIVYRIKGRVPFIGAANVPAFPSLIAVWEPIQRGADWEPHFRTLGFSYARTADD